MGWAKNTAGLIVAGTLATALVTCAFNEAAWDTATKDPENKNDDKSEQFFREMGKNLRENTISFLEGGAGIEEEQYELSNGENKSIDDMTPMEACTLANDKERELNEELIRKCVGDEGAQP